MNKSLKKLFNILGNVVTIVAIYFVFKKLFSSKIDYSRIFNQRDIFMVLLITIVLSIIIILNCFPWKTLVEIFAKDKLPWLDTIKVYTKSNLLKYLPGNVFQYIGRNELAAKLNISHVQVAAATILDVGVNVLAGVILSSIYLVKNNLLTNIFNKFSFGISLSIVLGTFLLLIVIFYVVKNKFKNLIKKYQYLFTKSTIKGLLVCLLYYIITMLIQSLLFITILVYVVGVDLNFNLFLNLFSAYTFSWLVGFVTPGAPAGIGVREAVMAGATGGLINEATITFAMVIFRILTTLADGAAFLTVLGYSKLKK
jgi:uncharacterized membrane protein YbhN (UPF0104 family)